jgi:hypothetical protein
MHFTVSSVLFFPAGPADLRDDAGHVPGCFLLAGLTGWQSFLRAELSRNPSTSAGPSLPVHCFVFAPVISSTPGGPKARAQLRMKITRSCASGATRLANPTISFIHPRSRRVPVGEEDHGHLIFTSPVPSTFGNVIIYTKFVLFFIGVYKW